MPRNLRDWQAPPFEATDENKLGWARECIETGNRWMLNQPATKDTSKGLNILAGRALNPYPTWRNQSSAYLTTGDLQSYVRDVVETLANIKPSWGYKTDNKAFLAQANVMNQVAQAVYLRYFVDRSLRDALQFAALTGAGFISPGYARSMYGRGRSEFTFEALGQPDVLPVQLPRNRDYQQAYAVTISKILPVAKAHAMFPAYQSKLQPFARDKYLKGGSQERIQSRKDRWQMHSIDTLVELYCEVFWTYIIDLRINDTGMMLPMGESGTTWAYEVPSLGDPVQRFEDGRVITRAATEDDARVYPFRRLMISCDAALMYDGPGFDQHGMVPLVPFYLNDYAWEGTGYSLFAATAHQQYALDALEASKLRIAMARANPGKAYNADIMSKDAKLSTRDAEALDPFDPNVTFPVDGDIGEGAVMRPPMPEWCYNIPEWVNIEGEGLREMMKRSLGLDQIQGLQKLRANIQNPEQLLEAEGPVIVGSSRSMERSMRDMGEMTKYNILQYMSVAEMAEFVGVDQIPPEILDMEPNSLVPSHLPGEPITAGSSFTRAERTRHLADSMPFIVDPHSLHEINQRERRLNILALVGRGVPIDPETLAKEFDVPNWGTLEGSTIKEKLLSYLKEETEAKIMVAQMEMASGLGGPPPAPGGEGGGGEAPPAAAAPEGPSHGETGKPEGRPPTFKKSPKVKQKGIASGGRVVVTTS